MSYREKLSSELIDQLNGGLSTTEKILICDALLSRKEKIRGLNQTFESLFKALTRKELKQLELIDEQLSPASAHAVYQEMRYRRMTPAQWFVIKDKEQLGPMDRSELEEMISRENGDLLVWKEGTAKWVRSSTIGSLNTEYYFDQEINELQNTSRSIPARKSNVDHASNTWLMIGLLQLILAIPFWIIMIFGTFFTGFTSVSGPVLPFMFSLTMVFLSIPMGIALIKGAKWAYQTRVGTGVLSLLLFGSRYFIDDGSALWLLFFFFELTFLALLITYAEGKRTKFA
jgi:hypothetical protein